MISNHLVIQINLACLEISTDPQGHQVKLVTKPL